MDILNIQQMNEYFITVWPEEGCGFLVDGMFLPMPNIAENPQTDFKISGIEFVKHNVQAVIHSHVVSKDFPKDEFGRTYDFRTPSMNDMKCQIDTNVPWAIVATDGENVNEPIWFGKNQPDDLYGRPFIHNVYDCYEAIRDWYKLNSKVRMSSYPRPLFWAEYDQNLYENNYKREGFVKVEKGSEEYGDMVYFKIRTNYVNHAGIYLGHDTFYHHLYGRLSGDDRLSKWYKQFVYACRHPNLL